MKVELVTLHRVRNFGSLLQTYATQTVVEKMGAEVEVCDYVPQGLTVSHGFLELNGREIRSRILRVLV